MTLALLGQNLYKYLGFNAVKYLLGCFLSGLDSLPHLLSKSLKSEVIIQGKRVQINFKTVT